MSASHCSAEFLESHPDAAARVLDGFDADQIDALLRSLPATVAARCLERLAPQVAAECLALFERARGSAVLQQLPVPIGGALLRRLNASVRASILAAVPSTTELALRMSLRYPPGTVGSLVDPQVVAVQEDTRVEDAVALARREPKLLRRYLYVVDEAHRLVGAVDVRDCLVHGGDTSIGTLVERDVLALRARASLELAREHAGWSRFGILPVVDRERVLLGVLRRAALQENTSSSALTTRSSAMFDAVVDVAELYWGATLQVLLPSPPGATEGDHEHES